MLECDAWCADEDVMHQLFRLHASELAVPGEPHPILQFLSQRLDSAAGGTPRFCEVMETWVREQLAI